MVDVSVIIVNYNTCELTLDCIKSIYTKTLKTSVEIIVVDNASSDNSVSEIRSIYPEVILIESTQNLGFGKANNLAVLSAKGKYLFFLNSDTILVNDAISILKEYMENNPDVGICGGNLFDQEMNPNHSHLKVFPSVFNDVDLSTRRMISRIFIRNMQFNNSNTPIEVAYITGADMMIKKELFNEILGFDPDFFLYYEETDLTYRVKKMGYHVVNVPSSKIIHFEGKSSTISNFKMEVMQRSRLLFFSKSYSKLYCTIADVNYLLLNVLSICLCYIFNRSEAQRLIQKTKIFLNIRKGKLC